MMEETKVTMSIERRKSITAHVKVIMRSKRGLFANPDNIDIRKEFSDYVINHILGGEKGAIVHFQRDNNEERVKALAHELYLQYMQIWEELYGDKYKTEEKDDNAQEA